MLVLEGHFRASLLWMCFTGSSLRLRGTEARRGEDGQREDRMPGSSSPGPWAIAVPFIPDTCTL